MTEATQQIHGIVRTVVFAGEESGYAVLRLDCDGEELVCVGTIPYPAPGELISAYGRFGSHVNYGRQFKAERVTRELPATRENVFEYLASGVIRGLGVSTAKAMVDQFGDRALEVLENDPDKLCALKGMNYARAKKLSETFKAQAGLRRLMEFLAYHQLPTHIALALYQRFGENALAAVKVDPYLLVFKPYAVPFHAADTLAFSLGFDLSDAPRTEAGVLFTLQYNLEQGHAYLTRDKLLPAAAQMLNVSAEEMEDTLTVLLDKGAVIADEVRGQTACYLPDLFAAETDAAERARRLTLIPPDSPRGLTDILERVETSLNITLARAQKQAVLMSARSRLMLLTGGPGTGKTTTIRAILALYDALGLTALLCAPTGRAAKRMTELTGRPAATIHRLLEMQKCGLDFVFTRDESCPLECDVVVVDEMSMVDIVLFDALLRALPDGARMVLVGDPDQLPSVGPGSVLRDLLLSERVDTVRLTEVFRQALLSDIVRGAHAVNHGEMPPLRGGRDLFFMSRSDAGQATETIVQLCIERLPKFLEGTPEMVQVLTPTRRGALGTAELNRRLQETLNPPDAVKTERKHGDVVFREGDRVMQIHNNYQLPWRTAEGVDGQGVFNGDIGRILTVDNRKERMVVVIDDREYAYPFEELWQLEHAWAMTVHKSQGSEYPAVVLACLPAAPPLMIRRVLYTAMTRAQKLLVFVGDENVVRRMVDTDRQVKRYSGLLTRLKESN